MNDPRMFPSISNPHRALGQGLRTPAILAVLALCLLAAGGSVWGQEPEGTPGDGPAAPRSVADFIAGREASGAGGEQVGGSAAGEPPPIELPDTAGLERLDPAIRDEALESIREYYRYRTSGFQHRRRVFDWQLFSSKIIFVVVVLLVCSGIYFSGVQFHAALGRPGRGGGEGEAAGSAGGGLGGELEAGPSGIKVSSPVLGVIILVISFLFFYLYLVHVHPIEEIF